ncbi:hypothetical protein BLFGPEAP_02057 [Candidatus Methanoperedenaceae archaeon GB50]|nr:hypothetical protein BLFGPEAP_02057 [Candidatus Methanoperedenaceae archaeon GB50]
MILVLAIWQPALGIPSFVIFGPTNVNIWKPWGKGSRGHLILKFHVLPVVMKKGETALTEFV